MSQDYPRPGIDATLKTLEPAPASPDVLERDKRVRDEALEEAAKAADNPYHTRKHIASVIRALKSGR